MVQGQPPTKHWRICHSLLPPMPGNVWKFARGAQECRRDEGMRTHMYEHAVWNEFVCIVFVLCKDRGVGEKRQGGRGKR